MRAVLLDSDVIIANFRNHPATIEMLEHLREERALLYVCPVALAEIGAGMRPGDETTIDDFFRSVECLPINDAVGRKAGEYLRLYAKSSGVEIADALVAAVASCNHLELFTLNLKHYPMKGIKIIGTRTASP